jgi:FtsH-binding integral membrane protein
VNQKYGYPPNYPGYAGAQPDVRPAAQLSAAFLSQAFFWMFLGLLLTAFVTFLVQSNTGLIETVAEFWIAFVLAEMGLSIAIQAGITRFSATTSLLLFFIFAAINGLTFGVIVYAYASAGSGLTIVEAFASAGAMFGGAALFGAVTKRNLGGMFAICAMATWGMAVAFFLNFMFANSTLTLIVSLIGVVVYAGLTASTIQKIQQGQFAAATRSMEKAAIWGALLLYMEFISLVLLMLRLLGGGRR